MNGGALARLIARYGEALVVSGTSIPCLISKTGEAEYTCLCILGTSARYPTGLLITYRGEPYVLSSVAPVCTGCAGKELFTRLTIKPESIVRAGEFAALFRDEFLPVIFNTVVVDNKSEVYTQAALCGVYGSMAGHKPATVKLCGGIPPAQAAAIYESISALYADQTPGQLIINEMPPLTALFSGFSYGQTAWDTDACTLEFTAYQPAGREEA